MEKLSVMSNFVKAVESLRNTVCSRKEKIQYFHQIAEALALPSVVSHENYGKHVSSGISVLLFFCEDLDSVVRMSAEENLSRIFRTVENSRLSRVLLDLYNEIKKNGNQKTLRICLNLFAYYCPRMKEKNLKWYTLKLLPCLQIIAQRKETLLVESLTEFMKHFSQHLQICLNDNETIKLLEVFISNTTSDCAVKRRCSAQNCIHLIQGAHNKDLMAMKSLSKSLEYLHHDGRSTNTLIGVLGFFRLLLPIIISSAECDCKQIMDIYDLCLHLLNSWNHSIINASLEVINAILTGLSPELKEVLISQGIHQNDLLKKRKSLKNQIFRSKHAEMTCSASPSTLASSTKGKENEQGVDRGEQKIHALGKLSAETIKDAFKSGGMKSQYEGGSRFDERLGIGISAADAGCNKANNAGQDSVSTSSTNEIKINDEPTTVDVSGSPSMVSQIIVDRVEDDENAISFAYANKETSTSTTLTSAIGVVPQIDEPQEEGHLQCNEDKSQILSDVDNESFNSIDFESEITIEIGNDGNDNESKIERSNEKSNDKTNQDEDKQRIDEKTDGKSIKSTDSIGAFFNNLLSHPNTESMTKLFRPSSKLSATTTASPSSPSVSSSASRTKAKQTIDTKGLDSNLEPATKDTAKTTPTILAVSSGIGGVGTPATTTTLTFEDDTISIESINSHISLSSHVSQQSRNEQDSMLALGNDAEIERKSDGAVWYEVEEGSLVDREPQMSPKQNRVNEISITVSTKSEPKYGEYHSGSPAHDASFVSARKGDLGGNLKDFDVASRIQHKIGSIHEQNIIYYTVRMIASRFLLDGKPGGLISDAAARVSVKSLSLAVLGNCVELKPEVLYMPLEFDKLEAINFDISPDHSNDNSSGSVSANDFYIGYQSEIVTEEKSTQDTTAEDSLLEIKDDHFGESTNPYLFDTPMGKSADEMLLARLKNMPLVKESPLGQRRKNDTENINNPCRRLNQQLEQILSKSEIIESKSCVQKPVIVHPLSPQALKPQSAKLESVVPFNAFESFDSKSNQSTNTDLKKQSDIYALEQKKLWRNISRAHKMGLCSARGDPSNLTFIESPDTVEMRHHENHHHKVRYNQCEHQFIHDIFLYCNHPDPVLRGNMQIIAYNFTKACLSGLSRCSEINEPNNMEVGRHDDKLSLLYGPLDIEKLLKILIKGLQDDIHSVVIQALTFFDKIFDRLVSNHFSLQKISSNQTIDFYGDEEYDPNMTNMSMAADLPILSDSQKGSPISLKFLLSQLQFCHANRYWLVQNKYAEILSNLSIDAIRDVYGDEIAVMYEDIFMQQLLHLLGDEDVRVRNNVAVCLCNYIQNKRVLTIAAMKTNDIDLTLVEEFLTHRIFHGWSKSLRELLKNSRTIEQSSCRLLSRMLFLVTNMLMDLDKKNIQFGIINAVRALLNEFSAIDYLHIWNEFNLIEICLCFMLQNLTTAVDIGMQISLIEINTKLLSANLLKDNDLNLGQSVDNLFDHAMRILNIYYSLFSNQKPSILSKPTKPDSLFVSAKDVGSHQAEDNKKDFIYMKLYEILKTVYDNYKISINHESGSKLMSLAASCLNALSTLLELKQISNVPNGNVKLIEETLQYLTVILNYLPTETINCLRQLLKFLFCRNYGNRKVEYEHFLKLYFTIRNCERHENAYIMSDKRAASDMSAVASTQQHQRDGRGIRKEDQRVTEESTNDGEHGSESRKDSVGGIGDRFNLSDLFASAISFPLGKSKLEESSAKHIKLFEPLVIYCLTLFMKSNAVVQSSILDMLSDLLEYNVTYSILDSKNIIFEQVESNVELIESGTARNSGLLIKSIVKFLMRLTKQSDRKLTSIPKIINIINNLFTNNTLSECSMIALKELSFEIFFKSLKDAGRSSNKVQTMQDLNTEREVTLRMLEQFIGNVECLKVLNILLLWARTGQASKMNSDTAGAPVPAPSENAEPMETNAHIELSLIVQDEAILSIVIGGLHNDVISVYNYQTYLILNAIFRNCDKSILLKSDLFEAMLKLFIQKNVENFNNLSNAVIILDNVILKTEQIYLVNHVKLLFMKNNVQLDSSKNEYVVDGKDESHTGMDEQHDKSQRHEHDRVLGSRVVAADLDSEVSPRKAIDDEINYFVKVLYSMLETCFATSIARPGDTDYRYLTSKFIKSLAEATGKFEKMRAPLCLLLTHNSTIYEKLESSSEYPEGIAADILILLGELCLGRDEGSGSSSDSSSSFCLTLQPRSILKYIHKIREIDGKRAVLKQICEKFWDINWWMTEDVKMLLSMELIPVFLNVSADLGRKIVEHPIYARILLEQLLAFPSEFYKDTMPTILELLRGININASFLKLKFLWRMFIDESSRNSRFLRKLIQLHFDNELQSFKSQLQRSDCKALCARNNDAIDILKEISNANSEEHWNTLCLSTQNTLQRLLKLFTNGGRLTEDELMLIESNSQQFDSTRLSELKSEINEKWLMQQVVNISSHCDCKTLAKVLMDFKSEIKLKSIFNAENFPRADILGPCLDISFHSMITSFQNNCMQYNPHINYMNVNPLLRVTLQTYLQALGNVIQNKNENDFETLSLSTFSLMMNLDRLESISLLYIKLPAIDKFVRDQLLKSEVPIERLLCEYVALIAKRLQMLLNLKTSKESSVKGEIQMYLQCLDAILKQKLVWLELNQPRKYEGHLNAVLDVLHEGMTNSIRNTSFFRHYWLQRDEERFSSDERIEKYSGAQGDVEMHRHFGSRNQDTEYEERTIRMWKAIFLGKLIEASMDGYDDTNSVKMIFSRRLMKTFKSIAISLLRTNYYYGLAVIPYELFRTYSYDKQLGSYAKLPSIPVDHLSDVDILRKFIKRLSIFGFSTRQQFEEYFMTFLLLINRVYDVNMVDEQEQFLIKNTCLVVIMELLVMCKTFPVVGNNLSKFHHSIRWQRIKCRNNISLKKLHKIQLIVPGVNVFYHPNLERDLSAICHDSIIGTNYFLPNQYELNHVWQQMESLSNEGMNMSSMGTLFGTEAGFGILGGGDGGNITGGLGEANDIKEDTSRIDLKSSCQLIFDVFTQIIEQNHVLVLPNLVKFCEICDNREHVRWIKNAVMKLQEQIPFDDTVSHQYIIYLLCRTQSILVPSFAELSHLCSIISTYLKSTHIFIRNATLHGLLCLLECCSKTSTSMGKLSEELCLLREVIVSYITRHGIVDESSSIVSELHTKLVWTLNFSLIEMTTKFVPECHLLSNAIISANNLLKRTTNEIVYLCIVHGLERIMVVSGTQKPICDKVEKLALELVKVENERFSLPALKLLLSCVYMGSSKQLETTEHSNGIVQDDPEIIAQQTEKVDVLLHRIKSSTSSAARIYGEVLCQIVRDLVPPNEILTKVIKEFLAINQPHCEVIARIVYQVFRSCIDSSFLRMLQDWLICSLPNFLTLPPENGIWCLTIIFLSSSINLDLIKLFPFALSDSKVLDDVRSLLFIISARDFYMKLNTEQKTRFRDIFKDCELEIYTEMLKCL